MAELPVIIAPDPRLKKKSARVETVDDSVREKLDAMLETMYARDGIGLAGPQVDIHQALVVCDIAREGESAHPVRLVNPEVVWASDEQATNEEGCLSLPDQYAEVTRPARVRVEYRDETGTAQAMDADGLLATALQHEIDHLFGRLFVDHLSKVKRNMILRRLSKERRQKGAA